MSIARKGYKHTEESKKKMSIWKKEHFKGDNHPNYGKHHSEKTKEKISKSKTGEKNQKKI